ncbi:hypothetical protein AXF42_Ash013815 [Apostasia shenzhenica]|uniref:Uncharacterized protein n=1 Tax=Apostasia shenzhenica TaxID=1088818 RepID=A0A2I0A4Y8_9ASPA|nr:hypothetical protein AXF42_Ash013815 [Apostasia shenzhenica]
MGFFHLLAQKSQSLRLSQKGLVSQPNKIWAELAQSKAPSQPSPKVGRGGEQLGPATKVRYRWQAEERPRPAHLTQYRNRRSCQTLGRPPREAVGATDLTRKQRSDDTPKTRRERAENATQTCRKCCVFDASSDVDNASKMHRKRVENASNTRGKCVEHAWQTRGKRVANASKPRQKHVETASKTRYFQKVCDAALTRSRLGFHAFVTPLSRVRDAAFTRSRLFDS